MQDKPIDQDQEFASFEAEQEALRREIAKMPQRTAKQREARMIAWAKGQQKLQKRGS